MGLEVVVFERNDKIGGVWNVTNPDVRLQKIAGQYHLSDSHVAFPD
jgi:cation diffusion facilitator CzcD-associated flavoprotein CzcO